MENSVLAPAENRSALESKSTLESDRDFARRQETSKGEISTEKSELIKNLARRLSRTPAAQGGQKRRRRWMTWIVVLSLLIGGLMVWRATRPLAVEIAIATYQRAGAAANPVLRQSGYVTYSRIVTVGSTSAGILSDVKVEAGDHVEQGALLATFEHAALLAQKRLQETQLADTEQTLHRVQTMYAAGAASALELQQAETALKAASAQLEVINTNIAAAYVRAPFSGRILSLLAHTGERAPAGLCVLADDARTLIAFDVSQEDLHLLKDEQPALVVFDAYPDLEYAAVLDQIQTTADRTTNSVAASVALLKPDARILPNMSARVYLVNETQNENTRVQSKLALAQSAIARDETGEYVWLIEDERVKIKRIETASIFGEGGIEIVAGLNPDDIVVNNPSHYTLGNGARVVATH